MKRFDNQKMKQLREAHRMSHAEVSRRIGVSQAMYAYIELGTRIPRADVAANIAMLFGVTLDELMIDV